MWMKERNTCESRASEDMEREGQRLEWDTEMKRPGVHTERKENKGSCVHIWDTKKENRQEERETVLDLREFADRFISNFIHLHFPEVQPKNR